MRQANIHLYEQQVGILTELPAGKYTFIYLPGYQGEPISHTLPVQENPYEFDHFPPFFEGLLPEGFQLQGLLRIQKIDRYDYFAQLVATGADLVGAVTVTSIP